MRWKILVTLTAIAISAALASCVILINYFANNGFDKNFAVETVILWSVVTGMITFVTLDRYEKKE